MSNALIRAVTRCLCVAAVGASTSLWAAQTYSGTVLSLNPTAFWQLNETADPSTGTLQAVDSTGHGFTGTYGTTAQNGYHLVLAPQPPTFPGFATGQSALRTGNADVNSTVTIPPLNLSPTTVDTTIAMWINPNGAVPADCGLLFDRGTAVAGFGFQAANTTVGLTALGYNWNDSNTTWGWNSGLYPQLFTWSFVALVVETNKATIYLYYVDPNTSQPRLLSAVNSVNHSPVAWNQGTMRIGNDPNNANRTFPGDISGVAVFNSALKQEQILSMFAAGLGVQGIAPQITTQPRSAYVIAGSKVQMSATGISGTAPMTLQWKLNGTDVDLLPNSANFVGAKSNILTILNATSADAGSYQLTVQNSIGTTLSTAATLTIQAPALIGQWVNGTTAAQELQDVSGNSLAANHSAFAVGAGYYEFADDVPPGKTGKSLRLLGDSGLAINNSSTQDVNYDNTFDDRINQAFTVSCWAKNLPGTWNPWVSKYGEGALGWQIRVEGGGPYSCFTVRNGNASTNVLGNGRDDLATRNTPSNDTNWHHYVGTFDASSGVRNLYVDGVLAASSIGNAPYGLASAEHLCIGARDSAPGSTYGNYFNGNIFDVRMYNYPLTLADVQGLYGVVAPVINVQPQGVSIFEGSKVQLVATAGGTAPLAFQWQLNGTNVNLLPDNANYTGINSNMLTILSLKPENVGMYRLVVTSTLGYGSATSSVASVTIMAKAMIGRWFTNDSLTEISGYSPAGRHDAIPVASGVYAFETDVPPGCVGQSVRLDGTGGFAVANSATSDGETYTNTFDRSAFTVTFWAKGRGGGGAPWRAWVAKDGYNNNGEYNGVGWSVGTVGWSQNSYFYMAGVDRGGTTFTKGAGLWGTEIMECQPALPGEDTTWHHYAITYSAAAGVRSLYFDGTLVAQQTGVAQYNPAPNQHLTIGAQEQIANGYVGLLTTRMFDVRFYNHDMDASQIVAMLPDPVISVHPRPAITAYATKTAKISATVLTHSTPVVMHWQLDGTNLVDGALGEAFISGANTATLTLSHVTTALQGTYRLVVSNPNGTVTSGNAVVTVLPTTPVPAGKLVGAWLNGAASLADTSGYSPAGTHDGFGVLGTGTPSSDYSFTNDVPASATGQALVLKGTTAIAIRNSSSTNVSYVNTFDDVINTNGMTVSCWAKGLPGTWNPWVSKYGENGAGWQLRVDGGARTPCWTLRGTGGNEDMSSTFGPSDGAWHLYTGTYSPVTGNRNLYVDGVLVASQTGQGPVNGSAISHLVIGARDNGGSNFGNYFTGHIYDVRVYNVELNEAQVNSLRPTVVTIPSFTGAPVLNGDKLVLTWAAGSLLQSTNAAGPWTPTGATSPYTNVVTTAPQMFFRLSNP